MHLSVVKHLVAPGGVQGFFQIPTAIIVTIHLHNVSQVKARLGAFSAWINY